MLHVGSVFRNRLRRFRKFVDLPDFEVELAWAPNFEGKLESHFEALYYCHGLKGDPAAAPLSAAAPKRSQLGADTSITTGEIWPCIPMEAQAKGVQQSPLSWAETGALPQIPSAPLCDISQCPFLWERCVMAQASWDTASHPGLGPKGGGAAQWLPMARHKTCSSSSGCLSTTFSLSHTRRLIFGLK